MSMEEDEYLRIQDILGMIGTMLQPLDLDGFLKAARTADNVGPFLHTNLYHNQGAGKALQKVINIAQKAKAMKAAHAAEVVL